MNLLILRAVGILQALLALRPDAAIDAARRRDDIFGRVLAPELQIQDHEPICGIAILEYIARIENPQDDLPVFLATRQRASRVRKLRKHLRLEHELARHALGKHRIGSRRNVAKRSRSASASSDHSTFIDHARA
jgi:hypothetical protein